ncbi:B12-binding domain-containing radical SAM protein [Patescibacteria group bacterium]|nr:B12-binding domain-containing radical SAM protein [Patescibacteria group bacterium]MCG2702084.1 B12-binding domain-containing radical SAM protein [Candidatus Parcubacteria bacterium]MBU4265132.1 B12-binding domain-containing radical SAM protein [Patescibacteria group bacterium]MBU4390696.1 B12-binding domain-containing radical SAM protein [Patescibacteria group bacterium]MBU4430964.1 B12-binding domain-containing radical SAM protein [Patescibacteria group bacterium]
MKTLLVCVGSFYSHRYEKFKHYISPLGISSISAYLKANGMDCYLIDMKLLSGWKEFGEKVLAISPDVVGLSLMTSEMGNTAGVINFIKKIRPKARIIVGGPHVTVLPKETVSMSGVDVGVIGEGEVTFLDLLRCFEKNGKLNFVNGIVFKLKDKIVFTKARQYIRNLDKLPFVDRNIIGSEGWYSKAYGLFFPMRYPFANVIVSRGCPGRCTMCQPTLDLIFGRPARFRSPENVVGEIRELIEKYKIKSIIFWDDTLTANVKWLEKFSNLLIRKKINIDWWCYSRVNNINDDILEIMKRSGCKMICFGVESGCQRILNEVMRKGTTVKQNIKAVSLCRKHGILVNANVMIGSPTETLKEVKMTDALLKITKPDIVWASVTSPLPGTYLEEDARKKGLIITKKWGDFTRGQIGKTKLKLKISLDEMVKYQTRWHQTRFKPIYIFRKYYLVACLRLFLCHIKQFHFERIFLDFLVGPIIEFGRRIYWRYYFRFKTRLHKSGVFVDESEEIVVQGEIKKFEFPAEFYRD